MTSDEKMELRTLRERVKLQADMIERRDSEREEVARALFGTGWKCCASLGPYVRGLVNELEESRAILASLPEDLVEHQRSITQQLKEPLP